MLGAHKATEMKRRASQRRAAHKARLAALTLKAETRRAAVEAGRGKTKVGSKGAAKSVGSKGAAKSTGRASKAEEIAPSLSQRLCILRSLLGPYRALSPLPRDEQE